MKHKNLKSCPTRSLCSVGITLILVTALILTTTLILTLRHPPGRGSGFNNMAGSAGLPLMPNEIGVRCRKVVDLALLSGDVAHRRDGG